MTCSWRGDWRHSTSSGRLRASLSAPFSPPVQPPPEGARYTDSKTRRHPLPHPLRWSSLAMRVTCSPHARARPSLRLATSSGSRARSLTHARRPPICAQAALQEPMGLHRNSPGLLPSPSPLASSWHCTPRRRRQRVARPDLPRSPARRRPSSPRMTRRSVAHVPRPVVPPQLPSQD